MKWYFKALLQKVLSVAPCGGSINRAFQKRYGELRSPQVSVHDILRVYADPIIERYGTVSGICVVDIGTGWLPVLPVTLALLGAKCMTFDVRRHLDQKLLLRTLDIVCRQLGTLPKQLDLRAAQEKLRIASASVELDDTLAAVGLEYQAPSDTSRLPVGASTQDVTVSRLVLPHIPPNVLPHVLVDQFRILKPGGISIHRLNLHDEYAQVDSSVTLVNFLRYPAWFWDNFGNNSIKYVNRARYPFYIDLFRTTGFRISRLESELDRRSFDALATMKLDREFRRHTPEELATIGFTVVLEKP